MVCFKSRGDGRRGEGRVNSLHLKCFKSCVCRNVEMSKCPAALAPIMNAGHLA